MNISTPYSQWSIPELFSRIRKLKAEKDAIILSHYYMPIELQRLHEKGGVADFIGDSLGLSLAAKNSKAKNLIFCGVLFMAETAHILNPYTQVYIPDKSAGCSLAESINAEKVRALKKQYPNIPVMAYINTYAETKTECDVICTSRNALNIARNLPGDTILFIPDRFMGNNLSAKIKRETGKNMIIWNGSCEVHEQFTPENLGLLKQAYPQADFLLHWEVPEHTVDHALNENTGILGSTGDIISYVGQSTAKEFILASECDLGATLRGLYPDKEFVTPCIKCPHMKKITLENTLMALEAIGTESETDYLVTLDETIRQKALVPIERMLELS